MKNKKQTILVVEDEAVLNDAYQMILNESGYDVLSAFDGKEALEITAENTIDLILLDLRMPVMNGIEFLREYVAQDKKAKIIVFSNYDMQKEIDEAYSLGADKYILKSWAGPKELVRVVGDILAN